MKSVLEPLIREENKSIGALCTQQVAEGVIDSLDEVCTRKVIEELCKAEAAQSGCSVGTIKSRLSLPMINMAATMGY